jgi:hypothetical protein
MSDTPRGPKRNLPSDEGHSNDPHRREESAQQPGVNTYSSSDTDDVNQDLTETASDNFRTEPFGEDADPTFDQVGKKDHKD